MKLDFEQFDLEGTIITIEVVDVIKRPHLAKAIKASSSPYAYLLQGSIKAHHKNDSDDWIVLIRNGINWLIVSDNLVNQNKGTFGKKTPEEKLLESLSNSKEQYSEISIGAKAMAILFRSLMNAYKVDVVSEYKKGGRPRKYDKDTMERIAMLNAQGISFREIAKQEKMSPNTAIRLVKEYKLAQIFNLDIQG